MAIDCPNGRIVRTPPELSMVFTPTGPLEIWTPAGTFIQSVDDLSNGIGTALDNGTTLITRRDEQVYDLYDHDFVHIGAISYKAAQITSNGDDKFYVANFIGTFHDIPGGVPQIKAISPAGVVLQTWTLPNDTGTGTGPVPFYGIGISPDETIAYIGEPPADYVDEGQSPPPSAVIRRFSLESSTYLSDLGTPLAPEGGLRPFYLGFGPFVVLADGSVIVAYFWNKLGGGGYDYTRVLRYSSAGTVLNTYDLGIGKPYSLARLPGDDSAFYLMDDNLGFIATPVPYRIRKIRVSDGAVLMDITRPTYSPTGLWLGSYSHERCDPKPPIPPPPQDPPDDDDDPRIPCRPQTDVGNGGTGNSGCNTGGVGYTRLYDGPFGTAPQHADPEDGESMINAKGVDLWVEIVHTDYPSGDITTYRRAMVELADPPSYEGGRKAGGLLGVGDVEHGLGNEQGGFEAATVDIAYADSADRLFRNLLDDQELEGDEVRIKLATIDGREQAVAPRVIARAVAQKPKLWSSLNASFSASDYLFSEFGPFGPGRQFPSWLIPEAVFPYAPYDSLKLPLPILYGEKSDEGAVDPLTGIINPKGLVPLIYVGPTSIATTVGTLPGIPLYDPNVEPPPFAEVTNLVSPPGQLTFHASIDHQFLLRYDVLVYTAGTTTPIITSKNLGLPTPDANGDVALDLTDFLNALPAGNYDVTVLAVSDGGEGESVASNSFTVPLTPEFGIGQSGGWAGPIDTDPSFAIIAVYNGGGSRMVLRRKVSVHFGIPHNFRVTWTEAPQASEYLVFMYPANSTWDLYFNPHTDDSGGVRFKRVPAAPTNSQDPDWDYFVDFTSPTDGALIPDVEGTTVLDQPWDTYVLTGHAIFDILGVYASDLGHGDPEAERQRVKINPAERGDILCPFFDNWPFDTTYRDFTGSDGAVYRMTVIYMRTKLSDDHKDGVINVTVNAIGIEDVGDGSGLPIVDAHAVQQHWIENFLLKNYRSGLWVTDGTHPKWEDGTAMVRSSSFARVQTMERGRLGDRGLTVGWYAADQKVLQDWFREWNQSTDSRLGINGHGQILIASLDDSLDTTAWPRVLHETDLFGDVVITMGEERENVVTGVCDWDPDKRQYRGQTFVYESQRAITQYKNRRKEGNKIESTILVEAPQLRWVLQRRLDRLQDGARVTEITGKVDLLDYDVGTGILLSTIDGTGDTGFVDKAMLILRRRFKVADRLVTLTLLDIDGFTVPQSQLMIIGDDTISVPTAVLIGGGGSPATEAGIVSN